MTVTTMGVATQAAANFELTYVTYLDDHGLVDTNLARAGFYGVLADLQLAEPAKDPDDQAAIMRYIHACHKASVDLLRGEIKQLLAMKPLTP